MAVKSGAGCVLVFFLSHWWLGSGWVSCSEGGSESSSAPQTDPGRWQPLLSSGANRVPEQRSIVAPWLSSKHLRWGGGISCSFPLEMKVVGI